MRLNSVAQGVPYGVGGYLFNIPGFYILRRCISNTRQMRGSSVQFGPVP